MVVDLDIIKEDTLFTEATQLTKMYSTQNEGIQILLPVSISCPDVTEEKPFTCP